MALPASPHPLRVWAGAACVALAFVTSADAQSSTRRATNLAALLAYPNFYHMQPILLVGTVAQQQNGEIRLSDGTGSLRVIPRGNAPDGIDEVRGQFWDLGRMKSDDPRLASYDLRALFHIDPDAAWPRPGEVTFIMAAAIVPALSSSRPTSPPIREIVLDAARYLDHTVTISGQYQGRNLRGDLPDAPGKSRFDFVLRSADAAIWVTNLRPKGKDARGKDFELGLDARIDTGRWLQISGTVKQGRGLLWIDGQAGSLALAQAPAETLAEDTEPPTAVPAGPAPEVVFSTPTTGETDVALGTNVRMQFSRDLDPTTLKGHLRATYTDGPGSEPGLATIDFASGYLPANRVVELKFSKPLERFRTVKVEILDGLLGTDRQPAKPWSMTFSLAGS